MRRLFVLLLAVLLWPMLATIAAAQYATLVADNVVTLTGKNTVVANGNVEVLYDGQRLRASRIVYNQFTDELDITGPITIVEANGAVLTGQSAQLSGDFKEGIIRGARFILDGQLQVAAAEMNRVDGRYNQLYKVVASSCNVCADRPTPLWQIRARRVVHDQLEKQMYFDDAWFEVAGVPIAYFPRLRLPDPTLKRSTGFLIPRIKTSTALGFGLKMPYFIAMGNHADLTLTPYVSAKTRTLEARFRREFTFGSLVVNGALSNDDLLPNSARTYLFAEGRFNLPKDFKLNVDLRLVSDESYLLEYGYSDADRLSNKVEITRTKRYEHISASFEQLRSLRSTEIPIEDTLATLLGRVTYERRSYPSLIGGEARFVFDLEGHERIAETIDATLLAACATAGTTECVARDVVRAGVLAAWRRDTTFGNGMIAAFDGQVAADAYWINEDSNYASALSHITPTAAVELRWPLSRVTASGATDVIEPMMQLAWTDTIGANVPNEDSKLVDFDEGNLLALSRFPGSDQYERGWRTTVGLGWTRLTSDGQEYAATIGKVFRFDDLGQFTRASGLDGNQSDWLVAGQIKRERLTLTNRSLFDNSLNFSKSETQVAWQGDKIAASGSYIWVVADADEERTTDTAELNFDAAYMFNQNWTASINGSYDGNTNETTKAGFGLAYVNECLNVDFSVSRRFTTSANVNASTDYGLKVSLNGFGREAKANTQSCAQVR